VVIGLLLCTNRASWGAPAPDDKESAPAPAPASADDDDEDEHDPSLFEDDDDQVADSPTPEVDRCKKRVTLAQRLAKSPLPKQMNGAVLAVWKWLGVERRRLRRRAREHDLRGRALFAQGDYDGAITEWVAAYCHIPHYDVLYNIAISFERQVDYEKAVAYLKRSILESPPSAAADREVQSYRVQVLSKLPARVKVATFPPKARITLRSDTGISAQGIANDNKPMLVRKGTYHLRVEREGYVPITEEITVKIGQPYSYYFRLQPQKGTARITTTPSDARLFVDKRLVGLGQFVERLPIGMHEVTVERDGRKSLTRSFEILANRDTRLHLTMDHKPKSGRNQLILAASGLGGLLGLGVTRTNSDDVLPNVLGIIGGAGLGAGVAYYSVPRDIRIAHSSLIVTSALVFGLEGAYITGLFVCDKNNVDDACDTEATSGVSTAAGAVGLLGAAVFANRFEVSAGDAALINSGALWGTIAGALFASAMDAGPRDTRGLGLAGLNLGLVAGYTLARQSEISRGRAALIDLSGIGGAIAALSLTSVVSEDVVQERTSHFGLLGMTIGLITGTYLTRNMDEPKSVRLGGLKAASSTVLDSAGQRTTLMGLTGSF
jgi:hypothetical protein